MQLMRSIFNNTLATDGFKIYRILNRAPFGEKANPDKPIKFDNNTLTADSLTLTVDPNSKKLIAPATNCLYIVYTKQSEPDDFKERFQSLSDLYAGRKIPRGQGSIANLLSDDILIDSRGHYTPGMDILFEGIMGWKKMADYLPYDYAP